MMLAVEPFPVMSKQMRKGTPEVKLESAQRPSLTYFRRRVSFVFHGLGPF